MYALFYRRADGTMDFIADATNVQLAIFLGKRSSLKGDLPVVGFENRIDGTTVECCHFENGEVVSCQKMGGNQAGFSA